MVSGRKQALIILISKKIDYKLKLIIGDNEGCFISLKGTVNQEDITILNAYALGSDTYKFFKNVVLV